MNNRGQTLILFVILIPIILTMLAIVVDVGVLVLEFQKTRGIVDDGIHEYFETLDEEKIRTLLELNDVPLDNFEIEISQNQVEVSLYYSIDSIFGKLINIKSYDIKVHREGILQDETVLITKKG